MKTTSATNTSRRRALIPALALLLKTASITLTCAASFLKAIAGVVVFLAGCIGAFAQVASISGTIDRNRQRIPNTVSHWAAVLAATLFVFSAAGAPLGIVGWGYNNYGQTTVPAGLTGVAIAAGSAHSLALKSDGSVIGWDTTATARPPSPPD